MVDGGGTLAVLFMVLSVGLVSVMVVLCVATTKERDGREEVRGFEDFDAGDAAKDRVGGGTLEWLGGGRW